MSGAPGPVLVDVAGTVLDDADRALIDHPAVGGVILFARNYESREQLAALVTAIRAVRDDLIIVADYEGGRVQRFIDGFTRIPPMAALGRYHARAPDDACHAANELGYLVAAELGAVGIDLPLAPVVDRDYGHSTVIGHRAFAGAPDTIASLAGAYANGLAVGGSAATLKHFPGHGWVRADSHAELPIDDRDRAALAIDWAPFAALVDAGVASVMMAHVHYPAVDSRPASLSSVWIEKILRGELGFAGCVFCDDLSMGGAVSFGDVATRCRAALAAGCDYLPVCNDRASARAACDAVLADREQGGSRRAALLAQLRAAQAETTPDETRLADARDVAARLVAQ